MLGDKVIVSKEQLDTVKGVAKILGEKEYDTSYGIVEFGVALLLYLSFDKETGTNEKILKAFGVWKALPDGKKMSDASMKYLALENKKEYISNRGFLSFLGVHTINVAPEQKVTVTMIADNTGFPERAISNCIFESGITFMMLASESEDKIKDTLFEWMNDADIMKIAGVIRRR